MKNYGIWITRHNHICLTGIQTQKSNIEFCKMCQQIRDSNQNTKLTSIPEGRDVVIKTLMILLMTLYVS